MTMSARKAKRRIVDMMSSTVIVQLRWLANDNDGMNLLRWLKLNPSHWSNRLRKALKDHARPV